MRVLSPTVHVDPPMAVYASYRIHDGMPVMHVSVRDSDYSDSQISLLGPPEWMAAFARALLEAVDTVEHEDHALRTVVARLEDGSTGEVELED